MNRIRAELSASAYITANGNGPAPSVLWATGAGLRCYDGLAHVDKF